MKHLNPTIHQPVRLRIMATLTALDPQEKINFVELRELLSVTDGNLGAHLQKLECEGYLVIEKTFVARKPCTFAKATSRGMAAFEEHVAALEAIIGRRDSPASSDAPKPQAS